MRFAANSPINSKLSEFFHPSVEVLANSAATFPIVGMLNKKPTKRSDLDSFFEKCHVIVTTSHIAGVNAKQSCRLELRITARFLFIDEAHHAEAPTWQLFQRTLQESARPAIYGDPLLREDGKSLDGRIVYKYPLRKAQKGRIF